VGHLDEHELAVLRAAAEAGQREAPQKLSAEPVDMSALEVSDPPAPGIDLSQLHAPDTSTPAAPIDMSRLQIPLADTRELHAQAMAQANLSRHQAQTHQQADTGGEPQPAAPAAPVNMSRMQVATSSDGAQNQAPIPPLPQQFATPSRNPNIALVPPPAPDKRRVQLSLQAPAPKPEVSRQQPAQPAAPPRTAASTDQGPGPEERPVAQVRALRVPSPRSAGTMKIWTAETTPHPNVFQNVQRVIRQSAKSDASVVLLAPPAIIGEKKRRSRPSVRRERPATPPPPPKH